MASQRVSCFYNRIAKKLGEENISPAVRTQLRKSLPTANVVQPQAKEGLFAGRHIQHGYNISDRGGNRTLRTWKPNIVRKRLFSYIMDRFIRVNVTTHALRCIDKAGGFDEYLLKTSYRKMDTEMGLFWKAKIEKLYQDFQNMEVVVFPPEVEAKFTERVRLVEARRAAANAAKRERMIESMKPKADVDGSMLVPVSYILDSTSTKQAQPEKREYGRRVFGEAGRIVLNF